MSTKKSDSGLEESGWYRAFLANIKTRIRTAQYEALRAANKELVSLYWDMGRLSLERQKESGWGKAVVERLAHDLQVEFPGVRGFSDQNQRGLCECLTFEHSLSNEAGEYLKGSHFHREMKGSYDRIPNRTLLCLGRVVLSTELKATNLSFLRLLI